MVEGCRLYCKRLVDYHYILVLEYLYDFGIGDLKHTLNYCWFSFGLRHYAPQNVGVDRVRVLFVQKGMTFGFLDCLHSAVARLSDLSFLGYLTLLG